MGRPRKRRKETGEHDQSNMEEGAGMNSQDALQDFSQDNTYASFSEPFPPVDFPFDFSASEPLPDVDIATWAAAGGMDPDPFGEIGGFPAPIQSPTSFMNNDDITNLLPSTPSPLQASQPSSQEEPTSNLPSCKCLPNLYASISSFQPLPKPSFPLTLGTLANATTLSRDVVRCKECPKTHVSALQNLMLLSTLLALIVNEYSKLLDHIDGRAAREETIVLRMGERFSTETMHLHTGTPDCPMGFNLELSGAEWCKMARKAVKQAVIGSDHSPRDSFTSVLEELEQRQNAWHATAEQHGQCKDCGQQERSDVVGTFSCLQMVNNIKRLLRGLNL
ncbi:hypothetical protein MMC07_007736 [Pseudocyphellaria aurata]|nr:hypothetical protein [Pseudocyphellaria aurata]